MDTDDPGVFKIQPSPNKINLLYTCNWSRSLQNSYS